MQSFSTTSARPLCALSVDPSASGSIAARNARPLASPRWSAVLGYKRRTVVRFFVIGFALTTSYAGSNLTLSPAIPLTSVAPAQPGFAISMVGDEATDYNQNTERDVIYTYSVQAVGYSSWTYGVYAETCSSTWLDPRGALGAGTYTYIVSTQGYHKEPYNYGWVEGHWVDEYDNPEDPEEVTGTHWEDGRYDAGFDWLWQSLGSATLTFTLGSGVAQSITFANPGQRQYGEVFAPGATATSGLPVTYVVVSGPASLTGGIVTITGVGTVVLQANQVGGPNTQTGVLYAPAQSVQQAFSTLKADQTIIFPTGSSLGYGSQPLSVLGITMSANGLPPVVSVASGPATISGTTLTISSTSGSVTLTASQPGDANHNPAAPVSRTFSVTKGTQVITAPTVASHTVADAPFAASATVNSGLPLAYSVVSGPAGVHASSGVVTLNGTPGTVVVRVSQDSGDGNWNPAAPITYSFVVTAPANWIGISIPTLGAVQYSAAQQTFPAVTVTTSALPVGTISAYLQTPAGAVIAGPVTAVPLPPTSTVSTGGTLGNGNGITGAYFNGTSLGSPGFTRTDGSIGFDWGDGSPGVGTEYYEPGHEEEEHDNPNDPEEVTGSHWVDAYSHWEEFSIRWTGYVQAPTSDSYTFIATTSDGVRLWVNGNQVINHWIDRAMSDSSSVPIALTQGQSYAITMEYYENWDQAGAQLSWSAPSRPRQVIPQQSLYTYQANAQFTTSLAWSISGLVLPAGQAVLPYYRLVINYTPSDGQGVPSSAVGLFEIVDLPSPTVVFPDVARVVGDPSFSLASSSTGGGVPSYSIVSQTPSGTISLTGSTVTVGAVGTARVRVIYPPTTGYYSGTAEATISVAAAPSAPGFLSADNAAFIVGRLGVAAVRLSGVPTPTLSLSSGSLPPWASLNTATGALSGTPPDAIGAPWSFRIMAANSVGTTEQQFTLAVLQPPVITSNPTAQAVDLGGAATFSVGATGTSPLSYQWRRSGVAVAGATRAALTLPTVVTEDAGSYDVVVANQAGSTNSAAALLTVNGPPLVTSHPVGVTLNRGQTATFTVAAIAVPGPAIYQWKKGATLLANGGNISGATTATLSVSNVQLADAASYSVVILNSYGTVTSNSATLAITPVAEASWLEINAPPVAQAGVLRFSGKAANTGTVSWAQGHYYSIKEWTWDGYSYDYQGQPIYVQGATIGNAILPFGTPPGVTANVDFYLVLPPSSFGFPDFGRRKYGIRLVPNGLAATVPTAERKIEIVSLDWLGSGWPRLTSPTVLNTVAGQSASYQTTASCSSGPVSNYVFSWVQEPILVPNSFSFNPATGSVSFTPAAPSAYPYRFNIYGSLNSTTIAPVHSVEVNVAPAGAGSPPVITTSATLPAGVAQYAYNVQLTATNSPCTWNWESGSLPYGLTLTISGVLSGVPLQPGSYAMILRAANTAGADPRQFSLTVAPAPSPAQINTQPQSVTAPMDSSVTLSVGASGNPLPAYRWEKDGVSIAGATDANLPLLRLQPSDAGSYRVLVQNAYDSRWSTPAIVTVAGGPASGLTAEYFDNSSPSGPRVARTDATVDFQWGVGQPHPLIGGETFSVRWSGILEAPVAGTYTISTATDDGVRVWINGSQSAFIDGWTVGSGVIDRSNSVTLAAGQRCSILVEFFHDTGSATAQLFWEYPGQSRQIIPSHRLFPSGTVVSPPSIITQPVGQAVAEGATVTLSIGATGDGPLSYQWRQDGATLQNGDGVGGATAAQLVLTGVTAARAGLYDVIVGNAGGSVTSQSAMLTVSNSPPTAPTIVTHPASQQTTPGANLSLFVGVAGSAPFGYQWRRSGVPLNGATNATLAFPAIQVGSAGRYDVVVVNGVGSTTSASANLVIVTGIPTSDDDGDGVDNATELMVGLNPFDPSDASGSSIQEFAYDKTNRLIRAWGVQYILDAEGNIKEVRP